ncbi:MAG: hypothetical protein JNJ91_04145 [Flavobacteriales bacterium]|nr:hypothetical protein [Flavobacteriales bacterium]
MIHRKIVLACIALCVVATVARGQFQVVHSTPNTTSTPQYIPVILSDGSLVTHHALDGAHIFRKYDEAGELIWSRSNEGYDYPTLYDESSFMMVADGAGGTWSGRLVKVEHFDVSTVEPSIWMDSVVQHFDIWRTNGAGEVMNATRLTKHHKASQGSMTGFLIGFDLAATPDGGVLMCAVTSDEVPSTDLVKLDANGGFLWSRCVGNSMIPLEEDRPTFTYSLQPHRSSVAVAPDGNIYYMEGELGANEQLLLAGLDMNGDLLWMNRYTYGNAGDQAFFEDIAVDADGSAHASGSLTSNVGKFHILLKVDGQGQLQRTDIYRAPSLILHSRLGIDDQGRRYQLVLGQPPFGTGKHGILIADTLGNPARYLRRNDLVVLPENISIHPQRLAVSGGRIAFTGLLNHEHVDLGYTTRYEALASFAPDAIAPCLMEDTTYAHIPVPIDPVMTTTSLSTAASIDVSAFYSAEPVTIDWTSTPLDELNDLCSFASSLMNLNVDVNDTKEDRDTRLIVNSLVTRGQPVLLNTAVGGVLEIIDARGGRVDRVRMNGQRTMDTSSWAAGMYTLVITDGITQHSERFILE